MDLQPRNDTKGGDAKGASQARAEKMEYLKVRLNEALIS